MSHLSRTVPRLPLICAMMLFVLIYLCLNWYFSSSIGRVVLEGKFPVGAVATLEFENYFGGVVTDQIHLSDQPLRDKQRVATQRLNAPVKRFKLMFSLDNVNRQSQDAVVNLYAVSIEQPFAISSFIPQSRLPTLFESDHFFGERNAFIQLRPNATGSQLVATLQSTQKLPRAPWYWAVFPALFLSFVLWLIMRNHSWRDIPALRDMSLGRKISTENEFDTINGIRGLAALLVLFSHAAPGFEAVNMGIALLFVISGFLLSKPFVLNPNLIFSLNTVERYLVKRIKRILPMYYVFIFIMYVLTLDFNTAARNVLFIEASGHLWPMTQIFTFYMLLPLVLLLTAMMARVNTLLPVLGLSLAAFLWFRFMSDWQPYYNGRFFKEFYLYAFLLGVAGAYLHFGTSKLRCFDRWPNTLSWLVLALLVVAIAWSAPVTPPLWIQGVIGSFYVKCVISVALIILCLRLSHTWLRRVIGNPVFRSIGVVGFSFYLLHGLGMDFAQHLLSSVLGFQAVGPRSWLLVTLAFAFTYCMSLLTYSYIERPFFGYRESKENVVSTGAKA